MTILLKNCKYVEIAKTIFEQVSEKHTNPKGQEVDIIKKSLQEDDKTIDNVKKIRHKLGCEIYKEFDSVLVCEKEQFSCSCYVVYVNRNSVVLEVTVNDTDQQFICKFDYTPINLTLANVVSKNKYRNLLNNVDKNLHKYFVECHYGKYMCMFMPKYQNDFRQFVQRKKYLLTEELKREDFKKEKTAFQKMLQNFEDEITTVRQACLKRNWYFTDVKLENFLFDYDEKTNEVNWCYGDLDSFCHLSNTDCIWTDAYVPTSDVVRAAQQKWKAEIRSKFKGDELDVSNVNVQAIQLYEEYGFNVFLLAVFSSRTDLTFETVHSETFESEKEKNIQTKLTSIHKKILKIKSSIIELLSTHPEQSNEMVAELFNNFFNDFVSQYSGAASKKFVKSYAKKMTKKFIDNYANNSSYQRFVKQYSNKST